MFLFIIEEKFEIVLDQTLFFPEAGGQSPDRGRLNEAEVLVVCVDPLKMKPRALPKSIVAEFKQ